jgi:hypothetical protein
MVLGISRIISFFLLCKHEKDHLARTENPYFSYLPNLIGVSLTPLFIFVDNTNRKDILTIYQNQTTITPERQHLSRIRRLFC